MIQPRILTVLLVVAAAAAPSLAHGQNFNAIGGKQATPTAPKVAPPPALPGAASNPRAAAPLTKVPTDMEPNEALFDAINRGDIVTARDAISRGADLGARNILGMTPMELSVDLGRNDISFMLLSMRGADDRAGRRQAAADTAAKSTPARQAKAPARVAPPKATASVQQPAPAQTARLFSGDGGTPSPNAGFLGFDTTRR
jgi:hypothetical protein